MSQVRILFVDDEKNILDGLRRMLRSMRGQWTMAFAESGREALELMAVEEPDVVVSDMRMPEMDGTQLLCAVQERYPDAIRIILSGHSDQFDIMRAVKPAHQFLSKPCEPDCLKRSLERAIALRRLFKNPNVRRAISQIESLPSLPPHFQAMSDELAKAEPDMGRLGAMVAQDMGLAASVLKLVNSAFFGLYQQVSDPAQAVNLLGLDVIKGLVFTVHLFSEFQWDAKSGFTPSFLWDHSTRVAALAKALAKAEGLERSVADECFVAGLLHDAGKLVLASAFPESYQTILTTAREENRSVREVERDILGTTHAEIGAYLLGIWGLSDSVVDAVFYHHRPAASAMKGFTPLTAAHVANCLDHELVVLHGNYAKPAPDEDYLDSLGLMDRLPEWRDTCSQALDIQTAEQGGHRGDGKDPVRG